jgi:putative ABC transport system permease protein
MNTLPPKWADRFLRWYCNPDLLEEIQGDAQELYFERLTNESKRSADLKYMWDVLRFFRWSNIRRRENEFAPGSGGALWNLNFKMTVRNASRNKLIFVVKILSLSACLGFALLLTAYVVNELTFDQFHVNHDRIYRISSRVSFQDHVTHYAVSPLPLGQALLDDIPEIENYFRFMYEDKPIYHLEDKIFYDEVTLAADSNFLNVLTFDFLKGNRHALTGPDRIALTESTAAKFFGDQDPMGKSVVYGQDILLEVAAVIKDVPANSHLKFDALISWETFDRNDGWDNLNAYTYVLLRPGASREEVENKMHSVLQTFHELIVREYKATFQVLFENITSIHFSETLNEDIAEKGNKNSLFILITVAGLFLITGLVNYLNLTLAELNTSLKKIGILRIFGGMVQGHGKILWAETIFTLLIVLPLVVLFCYLGFQLASDYLAIHIDWHILLHPAFTAVAFGFLAILVASNRVNAYLLSKTSHIMNSLRGKMGTGLRGIYIGKSLVAVQLSFSIIMIALIILIINQFHFIRDADKGFNDKNTVVIKLRRDSFNEVAAFNEAVRKLSGVAGVDGCSYYPEMIETKYVFQVESETGMKQLLVPMMNCGYGYLNALRINVIQGRGFDGSRTEDASHSFIINETAAKTFGWKNAIGKKIQGPVHGSNQLDREGSVVGVVKDFNFASMHSKIEPLIIFLSNEGWGSPFIYIRLNPIRSNNLISLIEKEFKAQWPELPFEWEYLDAKYLSLYEKDFQVKNISEIGLVISILISCLGIFSISALVVTLRTKEMGIRKVVGATPAQLFLLHTKSFLKFLIISVLVAWPVTWYLSDHWLQNFAYHVDITAWYFILPGCIAFAITLVMSGYHGIKSAQVNPVDILKYE